MRDHADTVTPEPSAKDWSRAVAEVFSWYPYDVFPDDSTTVDARSAKTARTTCIAITHRAWANRNAHLDGEDHG